jgi:hypothetical protein
VSKYRKIKKLKKYTGPYHCHLVDPANTRDNDDTGATVSTSLIVDDVDWGDCIRIYVLEEDTPVDIRLDIRNARRLLKMVARDVEKLAAIQKIEAD